MVGREGQPCLINVKHKRCCCHLDTAGFKVDGNLDRRHCRYLCGRGDMLRDTQQRALIIIGNMDCHSNDCQTLIAAAAGGMADGTGMLLFHNAVIHSPNGDRLRSGPGRGYEGQGSCIAKGSPLAFHLCLSAGGPGRDCHRASGQPAESDRIAIGIPNALRNQGMAIAFANQHRWCGRHPDDDRAIVGGARDAIPPVIHCMDKCWRDCGREGYCCRCCHHRVGHLQAHCQQRATFDRRRHIVFCK